MGDRKNISRVTLLGELGSRMIVFAMVLAAIIVGATSIYPKGFVVMFVTVRRICAATDVFFFSRMLIDRDRAASRWPWRLC